jgi:RNA polymerase sigma-70 factor (ECF subfamily)
LGKSNLRLTSRPFVRLTLQTVVDDTLRRRGFVQRDSFDRLLLQHLSAAQRFAIRLTGNAHNAEDLLHDAIVRAANGCERFEGRSSFTTWMFQIIVNCFRDRLRAKQMENLESEVSDVASPDASDPVSEAELGQQIAQHVSSLPPRQREVLVLIVYENLSVSDTAEVLGITQTNVRVNLSYAREQLKKELAIYLDESCRGV